MEVKYETLDRWPYGGSGTGKKRATFRASYPNTVSLLKSELEKIHARSVALQTGHRGEDIRFDGLPRVNARLPLFSGVCLTFEKWRSTGKSNENGQLLGVYDLLEYPCAMYSHWEDNLRAIALVLEAQRKIKRLGVGTEEKDQTYAGYGRKRVEAQTGASTAALTVEAAAAVMAACAEGGWAPAALLQSAPEMEAAYVAAAKNVHPDRGGSDQSMARVNEAAHVLRQHFRAKAKGASL